MILLTDKSRSAVLIMSIIRFYNLVWLVANDLILGVALAGIIADNSQRLTDLVQFVSSVIQTLLYKVFDLNERARKF
jgi:hypothetical protein